jgi:hypothetical protein
MSRIRESKRTLFIVVEIFEEYQKFLFVSAKDRLDLRWFLRVGDEHLKAMNIHHEMIWKPTLKT